MIGLLATLRPDIGKRNPVRKESTQENESRESGRNFRVVSVEHSQENEYDKEAEYRLGFESFSFPFSGHGDECG